MSENQKKCIKEAVGSVTHYAVTTDLWTSRAKYAYTSPTVHYVSGVFSLQSHLLETKEFPDNHTATNIAKELEAILREWNLLLDKLCTVTVQLTVIQTLSR